MPIYEYQCRSCEGRFELIVSGSSVPECPTCHGRDLEKQLSVFAVGKQQAAAAPAGCGTCGDPRGPGACARD